MDTSPTPSSDSVGAAVDPRYAAAQVSLMHNYGYDGGVPMNLERLGSTDALSVQIDRLLSGHEEDLGTLLRGNSLDNLLTSGTGAKALDDLLQDDFPWMRNDQPVSPLPQLKPIRIKPDPGYVATEEHCTTRTPTGSDRVDQYTDSPSYSQAHGMDGMSPASRKRSRMPNNELLPARDYVGTPTAAMRDLTVDPDQRFKPNAIRAVGVFGESCPGVPVAGTMSPGGLHRRLKVKTRKDTCGSPSSHSHSTSAEDTFTGMPGRACHTPHQAYSSAVQSPVNSPLARGHLTDGADAYHSPRAVARLSSCGGSSPAGTPRAAESLDRRTIVKNVNELHREAARLEQLNGLLEQQLGSLLEQIEQYQRENEVLRMVLAQVCRMRGDTPDAWNSLVARLRRPAPMLSDSHAIQMAASALSASQGNAVVALQRLLDTAMTKLKGSRPE